MGVQLTCEIDGLEELQADWREAMGALADGINRGVERGVTDAAAGARSSHPYQDRTRVLTESIKGWLDRSASRTAGGEAIGVLFAGAPYASFVESGTGPHDIYPKAGEGSMGPLPKGQSRRDKKDIGTHRVALRWEQGGQIRFAAMVHHPGSQQKPFMGPAVLKVERIIILEVELAELRAAEIMAR